MFNRPTLFVVGAGASKEVGLPVGDELARQIASVAADALDDPITLDGHIVKTHLAHVPQAQDALRLISNGVAQSGSIDRFIYRYAHRPEVAEVGKVLISACILRAERGSMIWYHQKHHDSKLPLFGSELEETWFTQFQRLLTDRVQQPTIGTVEENFRLICFNYDRCIQAYLAEAFRGAFDVDYALAMQMVGRLSITHVYGSVGRLPLKSAQGDLPDVPFGQIGATALEQSKNIRTFSEEIGSQKQMDIAASVAWAERIVFLGFSFEQLNMRLLTLTNDDPRGRLSIIATGKGISGNEVLEVKLRILKMLRRTMDAADIQIEPGTTCYSLMQSNWLNLTAL